MEFEQILKKYRHIVDEELDTFFNNKIKKTKGEFLKLSYSYLKEFVLRPGKRLRPITAIITYKSINDSNEKNIYPLSIVPELFHASSLIHDDIMDEDLLRRNKPTMHRIFESYFKENFLDKTYRGYLFNTLSKRFSLSMAIIQGNILYSLSNSCILESKLDENLRNKSLKIFNNAYQKTNEGQIFDLLMSLNEKSNIKDYIDMVTGKTSSPLSASIQFGAVLNNAEPYQLKALEQYARSIGIAFQIHDDIMDISKLMNKGREPGTDLKRGNKTLIIIKALQNSNANQKKFLLKVLGKNKATNAEIESSIKIIKNTGALDYTTNYANKIIVKAKKYLKESNLNKHGFKFFNNFADYVIERKI